MLSNSHNLVLFFLSKVRETSCGKAPGEKVLSNSRRLVVVRYQIGAEQLSEDLIHIVIVLRKTNPQQLPIDEIDIGVLMILLSGDHCDDVGRVQSECWNVSLATR